MTQTQATKRPWTIDQTPDAQGQFSITGTEDKCDSLSDSHYPMYEAVCKFHSEVNKQTNLQGND